jgi:hypothetical protein
MSRSRKCGLTAHAKSGRTSRPPFPDVSIRGRQGSGYTWQNDKRLECAMADSRGCRPRRWDGSAGFMPAATRSVNSYFGLESGPFSPSRSPEAPASPRGQCPSRRVRHRAPVDASAVLGPPVRTGDPTGGADFERSCPNRPFHRYLDRFEVALALLLLAAKGAGRFVAR